MSAGFQAVNIASKLDSRDMCFPLFGLQTTEHDGYVEVSIKYDKKRCGATFTFLLHLPLIYVISTESIKRQSPGDRGWTSSSGHLIGVGI